MLQRVVLGEPKTEAAKMLPDLSNRELATLIPLAILVLCIGLYPGPLMELMDVSVIHLIHQTTGMKIG
jgi:NADH-quinone oxidoreductase subunit M